MNQQLYLIRGEYVTLQTEARKLITQISAMHTKCEEIMRTYHLHEHQAGTYPSLSELENMQQLLATMKPLMQQHQSVHARLEELKPLAGL
jgi:chaperonin cofactor prefoldin